jgi:hypothetical protein
MPRTKIFAAALALFALAALAGTAGVAAAQEGSLRFEKTVAFQRDRLIELGAKVGPVRIAQVQFSTESGGDGGGIGDRIRSRMPGGGGDTSTTIRASFDSENPRDQEWVVTYTLEFLDANGKLIDRVTKKESFEGEADVVKVERPILTYVLPMVSKVRIRLEAALD